MRGGGERGAVALDDAVDHEAQVARLALGPKGHEHGHKHGEGHHEGPEGGEEDEEAEKEEAQLAAAEERHAREDRRRRAARDGHGDLGQRRLRLFEARARAVLVKVRDVHGVVDGQSDGEHRVERLVRPEGEPRGEDAREHAHDGGDDGHDHHARDDHVLRGQQQHHEGAGERGADGGHRLPAQAREDGVGGPVGAKVAARGHVLEAGEGALVLDEGLPALVVRPQGPDARAHVGGDGGVEGVEESDHVPVLNDDARLARVALKLVAAGAEEARLEELVDALHQGLLVLVGELAARPELEVIEDAVDLLVVHEAAVVVRPARRARARVLRVLAVLHDGLLQLRVEVEVRHVLHLRLNVLHGEGVDLPRPRVPEGEGVLRVHSVDHGDLVVAGLGAEELEARYVRGDGHGVVGHEEVGQVRSHFELRREGDQHGHGDARGQGKEVEAELEHGGRHAVAQEDHRLALGLDDALLEPVRLAAGPAAGAALLDVLGVEDHAAGQPGDHQQVVEEHHQADEDAEGAERGQRARRGEQQAEHRGGGGGQHGARRLLVGPGQARLVGARDDRGHARGELPAVHEDEDVVRADAEDEVDAQEEERVELLLLHDHAPEGERHGQRQDDLQDAADGDEDAAHVGPDVDEDKDHGSDGEECVGDEGVREAAAESEEFVPEAVDGAVLALRLPNVARGLRGRGAHPVNRLLERGAAAAAVLFGGLAQERGRELCALARLVPVLVALERPAR
mmetsp:Transcript_4197/g.12140  ORF Transcript_4197/g.12140 Transcript_4197/m.12140 type:complete len:739 (-) Transcript_4197:1001-3217(-)